jgi:Raf kinase inhibitor-like YbhB/YbcL family protein
MAHFLALLMALSGVQAPAMVLTSPAFKNEAPLPRTYTGYGDFKSPPLAWSAAPKATREFVLTVEDPDVPLARFSVHWLLYNIPATASSVPSITVDRETRTHPPPIQGASQGLNALKTRGYLPPRPFAGSGLHHYVFTLYALDIDLMLADGATKDEVLSAMKGHVIAEAKLVALLDANAQ